MSPQFFTGAGISHCARIAAIGTVVVAFGLTGCSGTKSAHPSSSSSMITTTPASAAPAPPGQSSGTPTETQAVAGGARLTIDGKSEDFKGQLSCTTSAETTNIVISQPTATIAIAMSQDASNVQSVGIGRVDGVSLSFQEHAAGVEAKATKDGNNYEIKGTAIGYDKDNPDKQITESFEIQVTCP
ncbi:lipoprotein LpqH [Mycolicibacterium anyangense]|jgi:lipoprotein LpqH|nr:lipoprotein LpqH [Mycolicibacterium anyangense]